MPLLMLGVRAHLCKIVHVCIFTSAPQRRISDGAVIGKCSFLSASFLGAAEECFEHPHARAPNQCESRRVKNWGKQRQCEGRGSSRLCVCLSMCAWARKKEREESSREIRERLKWDSKDRKAQIDIAITKKTISQLGIHLHTLGLRCLSNHSFSKGWLRNISYIIGACERVIAGQSLCTSSQSMLLIAQEEMLLAAELKPTKSIQCVEDVSVCCVRHSRVLNRHK